MIRWNKVFILILIVVLSLGLMAWTTNGIVKDIKLGLDLQGGFEILYQATPIEKGGKVTPDLLKQTAENLRNRVDQLGVREPEITIEGTDRIRVSIAGVSNQDELRKIIKTPAKLTIRDPQGKILLDGNDFVEGGANVGFDQSNLPIVSIKVKDKDKFAAITQKYLQQPLGIFLDQTEITAPTVQSVITNGTATISGQETIEKAQHLAEIINLGALPLNLNELNTNSVGATLGTLSLKDTVQAGLIGSIIVLIFMIVFYRVPGIIANLTLIAYVYLLLLVFSWMNVTLTLPGIAAIVLGIGMAVDANIITYERIKDEIRSGKTLLSSFKSGSRRSFGTILDANVTTVIAALVLYFLGSGGIKGFAITLIMSIVVSIVTNVFFSRIILGLVLRANLVKRPVYFGVKEAEIREL